MEEGKTPGLREPAVAGQGAEVTKARSSLPEEVARLAAELALEMRPAAARRTGPPAKDGPARPGERPAAASASLERDLGLDSLGRAELLARLERAFGVRLAEDVLASAETPADLARAVDAARQAAAGGELAGPGLPATNAGSAADEAARSATAAAGAGAMAARDEPDAWAVPSSARTLVEVLEWHAARHPQRRHLLFYASDAGEEEALELTYGELLRRARAVAAGLRGSKVGRQQAVALMLPSGHDYFVAFFGVLLAGAVPVPLYPPARRSQIEDHLRRQAGILTTSEAVALITFPAVMTAARLLRAQVTGLHRVATVPDLEAEGGEAAAEDLPLAAAAPTSGTADTSGIAGDDLAFLQFTSGSTGSPKGVMLTHDNLLANLRAIGEAVEIGPRDVVVSWLPLYHDMGLIGAWMASLYYGMPLILMSPLAFLARPARWLEALSRHRGTLSAAPNFAYELCAGKIGDDELAGLDLSAWRFALNGAEPVSPEAIRRFSERFAPYGFRAAAMAPVYGLAECSLAVAFPPLERGPRIDAIEREPFLRSGRAVPVSAAAGASVLRFVGCGMPLPRHELRVVDAGGHEVGERQEGRLQFRGPSATRGYYRDAEATRRLRHGDWLESGDRAYVVDGEVFVTGRDKDIIIRAGRNLYPHELEEAIGLVPEVRKGCVAAFGVGDPASGTERLVVVAETRQRTAAARQALQAAIQATALTLLGEPVDEVVLAPPHSVPKTSSGKIRRAATRQLYVSGRLGRGAGAMGLQLAHLALTGARVQAARMVGAAATRLYSAWVWAVFVACALPLWCAVALLPGRRWRRWRRALARQTARIMAAAAGLPLTVDGLAHLPAHAATGGRLVAVNHASYADGILLTALLPPDFGFVAKRELEDSFFTRVLMRRLGAFLVERFDRVQSAAEVGRAAAVLAAGDSLVIFPEGTFRREPGLRAFRLGAFLLAAQTGTAVVPAILHGTRHVLRDGAAIFRRGPVRLELLPAIAPDGDDWAAALRLRDRVRAAMLERAAEPDLAAQRG